MNIIKRDEEPDLEALKEQANLGTIIDDELKPEVIYTEEEIYLLADILEVDKSKAILCLSKVNHSSIPIITPINRSLLLKTIIEMAITNYYKNCPSNDRVSLFLYAEDIPFEDLPLFMPDNNDFIMSKIFKWRMSLKK